MLQELYQYSLKNGLAVNLAYEITDVKWYISFSKSGEFIGIENSLGKNICPNIGDLALGNKSHLIADKAEVLFLLPDKSGNTKNNLGQKHQFYVELMKKASEHDELIRIAITGFEQSFDIIKQKYISSPKSKPSDFVSMKVDGFAIEDSADYRKWWETYRRELYPDIPGNKVRCFVTGELMNRNTEPLPLIKGLKAVGGNSSGSRIYSFFASEHRSYGLFSDKGGNDLTSIEAMSAVKGAMNSLIQSGFKDASVGSKCIHWYRETPKIDILEAFDINIAIEDEQSDTDIEDEKKKKKKKEKNAEDIRKIKKMYKYIFDGKSLEKPDNRYYMMSLSGVNGRVMIRSFDEGSYDELYNNITQWYKDISLIRPDGKGEGSFPKLFMINTRLIKFSSDRTKLSDRIKDELSGLEPRIMYAITHNTPLPDSVAVRALSYIRSDLYGSSQEDGSSKEKQIDRTSCQILKAWLNRKYKNRNKEDHVIMTEINKDSPSRAYQTGRLMAVYAKIQNAALGDVNAGVVEKYYTSACSAPAMVIGRLATMSQYHLSKLDKGLAVYYSRMLEEIAEKIGNSIPANFSLTEQAEFALGYYHQNAEMSRKKNDNNKED